MKWTFLLSLLVLPFQVVSVAAAQTCPFTIDNVNADSVTSSCTHVSGDTWDLYLEIEHSTAMAGCSRSHQIDPCHCSPVPPASGADEPFVIVFAIHLHPFNPVPYFTLWRGRTRSAGWGLCRPYVEPTIARGKNWPLASDGRERRLRFA